MKSPIVRRVLVVFAIVAAVTVFLGAATYRSLARNMADGLWVAHTHQVLTELERTISLLKDAETSQRGYLLTGDESYLEPYRRAVSATDRRMADLARLTADNPTQQARIAALRPLVGTRLAQFHYTVEARRAGRSEAALAFVRSGHGRLITARIRDIVRQMEEMEQDLLHRRSTAAAWSARGTISLVVAGSAVNLLLLGLTILRLAQEIALRDKAEGERDRLATIAEASEDYIGLADRDGRILWRNEAYYRVMGIAPGESLTDRPFDECYTPWAARMIREEGMPAAARDGSWLGETALITRDGREVPVSQLLIARRGPDGEIESYATILRDLTERKRAEAAVRDSEARFHAFMNHSPTVAFMKDEESRFLYVNRTMERTFDVRWEDIRGQAALPGMPADVLDEVRRNDRAVLESGEPAEMYETVPTADGRGRIWQVMKFPFRGTDGRKLLGGVAFDVTEEKILEMKLAAANEQLEELAGTDALTGLANRRRIDEALETAYVRAARYGLPVSAILLDVDHFKKFNDTFGHAAGDEILQEVGRALRGAVRSSDLVGRYGGEEFIVVAPETDAPGAIELAERVRLAVAGRGWPEGRGVTISLGVATRTIQTADASELVASADEALYRSKHTGRNRVTHHAALDPYQAFSSPSYAAASPR